MKKKTKKQTVPTPEYDSKRETGVLLEEMNEGIKTIGEQHGSIIKKLEEHDKHFDRIESELTSVKIATIENSRDIKEVKAGQKNLELDIKNLKDGQKRIEQKLDTVTTDHEQRLQKLETVT